MKKNKSQKCLFLRLPIEISILEDWAKTSSDVAKTAIIALPTPVFYYHETSKEAMMYSLIGLFFIIITMQSLNIIIRQIISDRKED